jgi:signal transduction histidine kinase
MPSCFGGRLEGKKQIVVPDRQKPPARGSRLNKMRRFFSAFLSLRWRLSLVQSGVLAVCITICVLTAVVFLRQALSDRARSDLQHTVKGASAYLDREQKRLLGAAELMAADSTVVRSLKRRGALTPNERQTLTDELTPYYGDLNVDSLDVVDRSGRVVIALEDPGTWGYSARSMTDVRQGLAGYVWVGLDHNPRAPVSAAGWAIRASVPVLGSTGVIGTVVVGRLLDTSFASELGRVLNADVNLIVDGMRTGSTKINSAGLPLIDLKESPSIVARLASGTPTIEEVNEDGQTVLSALLPLDDARGRWIGAVEVVRPLDPLFNVINNLSLLLLVIGGAIVLGGALLALFFGRRLTRRLLTLQSRASEVADHAAQDAPLHDFAHQLPVDAADEVGSLARSFEAMMTALDDRMATNKALYEAAQTRVNELTGLAEVARLITVARPIRETLDALSLQVCRLVGCKAAAIYVPGSSPEESLWGSYGLPEGFASMVSSTMVAPPTEGMPLASQAAYVMGQPAWRLLDQEGTEFSAIFAAAGGQGWGAATAVPLRLQDRTIGVVACYTAEPAPLPAPQMSILTTVAGQVAVAVENARLYAQARDVAALEERARLARELHDSVTQALFSMTLHTRTAQILLERSGDGSPEQLQRTLTQLGDLTQGAHAEMRALIFELRPGALKEEGLAAALQKHCAALSARDGLEMDVVVPDTRLPIDPAVEEQLYRLAQEALHNIVKHAQATHVLVRLETAGDTVALEIADDGVGFDCASVPPGHLGLDNMRDRVGQLEGSIEIQSARGAGTTVRVVIPQPFVLTA